MTTERFAQLNGRATATATGLGGGPVAAAAAVAALIATFAANADFANTVINYTPAPGQSINDPLFNNPSNALGPPTGGGTLSPDNTGTLSLGGFGGSVTLRFSATVLDDPLNPLGLDAIVFGNAFYVGGSDQLRWAEAGIIEISRDTNNNNIADDQWFLIPGSDIDPSTAATVLAAQQWDDDPNTPTPPFDIATYPDPALYPAIGPSYATSTYTLPAVFDQTTLSNAASPDPSVIERYFGYADLTPTLILGDTDADNLIDDPSLTPAEFYTTPDNPRTVGITPGSGGGDAFDIATAIDPATGEPANLDGFDFIRISTAPNAAFGPLGERSTEIDAVADVRPNPASFDINSDGNVDIEDLYGYPARAAANDPAADLNGDTFIDAADRQLLTAAVRRNERADMEAQRP